LAADVRLAGALANGREQSLGLFRAQFLKRCRRLERALTNGERRLWLARLFSALTLRLLRGILLLLLGLRLWRVRRRWLVLILGGLVLLSLGVPLFLCLRRHKLTPQKIRQFEMAAAPCGSRGPTIRR
jgi:hypothetical protein